MLCISCHSFKAVTKPSSLIEDCFATQKCSLYTKLNLEVRLKQGFSIMQVGVTAMLIASKYEEIWAPEVRDFVYISDRAYTKEQILLMEKLILNKLKFDLTIPTTNTFLGRYLKAADLQHHKWSRLHAAYLSELAIPDYGMLKYANSEIAAASVLLTLRLLHSDRAYPKALARHSGYKASQLRPCAAALERLQAKASGSSLVAVYKKYSSSKFMEVALKFGEDESFSDDSDY